MKKYLKIVTLILMAVVVTLILSDNVFAEEEKIGTVEIRKEEQEVTIPSSDYNIELKEVDDKSSNMEHIRANALATGTINDPITVSNASAFSYTELSDGTLSITGLKTAQTSYYKLVIPATINGKKVTTIGRLAFKRDGNLKEVTLGSNVTTLAVGAFYDCYNLTTVNFANVKTIYSQAFLYTELNGNIVFPDTLETIAYCAFSSTSIESVTLGKNLKEIDSTAFMSTKLKEYKVNSSNANFTAVNGVLYNKAKTELVSYPVAKTDTTYTIPNTVTTIRANAAYGNKYLTTLKLNNNIETVPSWAFGQCSSLKNITFGSKIKTLADSCFASCAIETITIPASVTSMSGITFINCTKLKSVNVNSNNANYIAVNGVVFTKDKKTLVYYPIGKQDASYAIPSGTVTIGESAFQGAQFASVTIPASVKKLDDWCFAECKKLTAITIPATVTEYGYGPFTECSELTTAKVNSSASLTYLMFSDCPKLATVTLNTNIKKIDARAFYEDKALTTITLPSKLEEISVYAFKNTGIKKVTIPASVTYIWAGAFNDDTTIDISKTKLTKLDNEDYRVVGTVYINGTFDYKAAYECLNILNKERKAQGLSEVKMDKEILEAAMIRAAETALSFEHTRPNGTGYYSLNVEKIDSENIAVGSSTAQGAINQWMNSKDGHKENMLSSNWKSVGIGCFTTADGMTYWVQNFGTYDATVNSTVPSNVKKDVAIQTIEKHLDLVWRDSWKKEKTVDIGENETTTQNVRSINDGWTYTGTTILNKSFNWKSSDSSIATVDASGKVTAKKPGKVTITATVKDIPTKSISMTVNVKLPFKDVSTSSWYFNAVAYVYNNKIMTGGDEFAPNSKVTRGMIASIIYKMEGTPKVSGTTKFPDVQDSSKYYFKAVKWASDNKVVSGYSDGRFGPLDYVTREQLAVILHNYAKYKKKDVSKTTDLNEFADANRVGNYAKTAVKWAVATKVITGGVDKNTGNNILNPKGEATRAEIAAMIQKYCIYVGR